MGREAPLHSSRPQARGGLQGGGLDPEASGPCWAVQVKTQPWGHGVIISGKKLALAGARRAEGAGDVAQLVACLPSVHRALALIPSPTEVEHGSCNPRTWRLRPVWAAGDPENQTIKPSNLEQHCVEDRPVTGPHKPAQACSVPLASLALLVHLHPQADVKGYPWT